MIDSDDSDRTRIEALKQEIVEAHSALSSLRADISDAQTRLDGTESQLLLQANEQLVVAMMRAQGEADTAAAALEAASHSAEHDGLTRLPNRALLFDRWAQAAANARRHGMKMALLFIDLNEFKAVNDTLGHATGDEVLVAVAARLSRNVRQADTVARYGGDEFLVLLAEITDAADADAIARKLLAAISEPLVVRGHVLEVGASIGIGIYPDDAEDATTLIEMADNAMYSAKLVSAGGLQISSVPIAATTEQPSKGHYKLRQALGEQEKQNQLLRLANEQLLTAALSASDLHEGAERALSRHRTYLALLGHEIRTPLSPLSYAAAALTHGPLNEATLMRLRQTIERQVVHIGRLVDDMLALSFASRAALDVECVQADVVALARQAIEVCRPSTESRRQQLRLEADQLVQLARVDPVRVVQVFTNLIDNASKYSPIAGQITVTVKGTQGEVTIAVRDTGMGISLADTQSLFEPFARAPEALATGSSGLGIGLTVVREVIAAHHGSVEVHSEGVGKGAEFIVRLPR